MLNLVAEVDSFYLFCKADDIRDHLVDMILSQQGVQDVTISFDEDDGITIGNMSGIDQKHLPSKNNTK